MLSLQQSDLSLWQQTKHHLDNRRLSRWRHSDYAIYLVAILIGKKLCGVCTLSAIEPSIKHRTVECNAGELRSYWLYAEVPEGSGVGFHNFPAEAARRKHWTVEWGKISGLLVTAATFVASTSSPGDQARIQRTQTMFQAYFPFCQWPALINTFKYKEEMTGRKVEQRRGSPLSCM